jgi:four helix bundle protein
VDKVQGFKDLFAWQKAMQLAKDVYRLSACFPASEQFGLTAQLRRAAVSVPSNIAEGHGRRTKAHHIRFLDIARASANEVETQLLLAEQPGLLGKGSAGDCLRLCDEVQRIIKGLILSLERKRTSRPAPQASGLGPQTSKADP